MADEIRGDRIYTGAVQFGGTVTLPDSNITNAKVSASAAIAATKTVNRFAVSCKQWAGTAVAARTEEIHAARAAGSIVSFEVTNSTIPTGGDLAFTVDLKRSTAEGAFASILSAVLTFDSSKVARRIYTATLSSTTFIDGDIFQVVVAVSGSTGTQGLGLCCTLNIDENPS